MHFYFVRGCGFRNWIKIGDTYQATDDIICIVRDEFGTHYEFHFLPGFRCNGGSVPWCFRWFVPSWSPTNDLINIAFAIHDGLYGSELMHRDIADDLLRGLLRDAGLSRLKASTVCYAVNKFAESHYGQDKDGYDSRLFMKLHVYNP